MSLFDKLPKNKYLPLNKGKFLVKLIIMNFKDVKIEKVLLDGRFTNVYHIFINSDEYDICVQAASNMWANNKKGSRYNEGILNTKDDPIRSERIGRLGEMAYGKMIGQPIDTEYKEFGDTMDFFYKGYKINVKCAAKYYSSEITLIKSHTESGVAVGLRQDLYVIGYLKNENKQLKQANVVILGYQTKEFISKTEIKKAKENHYNYQVPYQYLLDISLI